MGVELSQPLITPESLAYNFTNEGGVCGTIRFLKNIMGLWLVQECRRDWARAGLSYTYNELTTMASQAPAFMAFIDFERCTLPASRRYGFSPAGLLPGDRPAYP